ncbi:MAG: asparagine synthase (glutamine-hydrolyzing) [Verrucomicrobiota bacterium]|nr:asparagine synthase (glutamine-hydrolyzing) [Verrucomicrobiota bacterium]
MCGIAGIVNFSGEPVTEATVRVMCEAIRHRGPDDDGYLVDGNVALGNRRLSIIDLSEKGRQPIFNEDGTLAIVYNGEIYNYASIRKDLESRGHRFRSDTDTEVIVHAYEEWGEECLHRFNGMWAFAIYDKRKRQIFLSRDRFGVKPLYYFADKERLMFCSEIKGLLTQNIPRYPDDRVIFEYLVYQLLDHSERTFFKGILRLQPGHIMMVDLAQGAHTIKRWYDLQPRPMEGEDVAVLKELFADSVRFRLVSDVPVGSCLSGGIDSSSIVCVMRQLSPGREIKTFTATFPGSRIDESGHAREVVRHAGAQGFDVAPTPSELIADLPDFVRTQEEPLFGTSAYAQYRVMKLAHESGMKVLLDGQGGDEVFAGYDRYFGFLFKDLLRQFRLPRLISEMRAYRRFARKAIPFQALAYSLLPASLRGAARRRRFAPWLNRRFLDANAPGQDPESRMWEAMGFNDFLAESIQCSSIPQLLRFEDKNGMRWSVESRVPFLDYRLVEYALSLPPERKIRDGIAKQVFREAMNGTLPRGVLERTDKIGFATPEDQWLRTPAIESFLRDVIGSASFMARGYWDAGAFARFFDAASRGGRASARQVWKVVFLELWLREFVD